MKKRVSCEVDVTFEMVKEFIAQTDPMSLLSISKASLIRLTHEDHMELADFFKDGPDELLGCLSTSAKLSEMWRKVPKVRNIFFCMAPPQHHIIGEEDRKG